MDNPWNPGVLIFNHRSPRAHKLNGYYGVTNIQRGTAIWTFQERVDPNSAGRTLVVKGFVTTEELPATALAACAGKHVWEVIDDVEILRRFSAADVVEHAEWDAEAEVSAFRVRSLAHR